MTIRWNVVTWYSQLLAVVIFVGVLCFGFYLGLQYKSVIQVNKTPTSNNTISTTRQNINSSNIIEAGYTVDNNKPLYALSPVQTYGDGVELVIIDTQGSKIIFRTHQIGTGGICDSTWLGDPDNYVYLDLANVSTGLQKYIVPTAKVEEAKAQLKDCQQNL